MKASRYGMTLVELLVATALALILLGAVIQMFGKVAESISDSRSMLEAAERLRLASVRLQQDLAGVTVRMDPPRKPETNEGYFEYIEGPVGVVAGALPQAINSDMAGNPVDSTVGDFDDVLMFTTRSTGRPFVGRNGATTVQSDYAEVAWFVRGRTLHRRVLLVAPYVTLPATANYATHDISMRMVNGVPVANTLGDLTMRENRLAHPTDKFPFDVCRWGQLRLPTLRECSSAGWAINQLPPSTPPNPTTTDFWTNDQSKRLGDDNLGSSTRIADDVILTNVIGFDVKVFDPNRNDYVDLGDGGTGRFSAASNVAVGRDDNIKMQNVYDTWSTHYESTGAPGLAGAPGRAINGFDDGGVNGIVDDDAERLTSPPYPHPLRGIQVKIRTFEPDSRQIREVTVIQDFLP